MFDVCVSPRERGAGQSTGQEGEAPAVGEIQESTFGVNFP